MMHLVDAARTVCERTSAWRENVELTTSTPNRVFLSEAFDPDWQAELHEVEELALNGRDLDAIDTAFLDEKYPGWDRTSDTGAAKYFTQLELDAISIVPREVGDVAARVVLKPVLGATELPNAIMSKYGILIGKGAAGEILGLPNTEYANPALGGILRGEFEAAMPAAGRAVRKGQQRARLRTKGNNF